MSGSDSTPSMMSNVNSEPSIPPPATNIDYIRDFNKVHCGAYTIVVHSWAQVSSLEYRWIKLQKAECTVENQQLLTDVKQHLLEIHELMIMSKTCDIPKFFETTDKIASISRPLTRDSNSSGQVAPFVSMDGVLTPAQSKRPRVDWLPFYGTRFRMDILRQIRNKKQQTVKGNTRKREWKKI